MSAYSSRTGLQVASVLADFVENRALAGTGIAADTLWDGLAKLLAEFTPRNRALLARRDDLQTQIDKWHLARKGQSHDVTAYETFLRDIGYLVEEPAPFTINTANVDAEIATMAGPQLVVPALNARFALNAANARWGSLYDALYGTDALDAPSAQPGGYDAARGAAVVKKARAILNEVLPIVGGNWEGLADFGFERGILFPALSDGTTIWFAEDVEYLGFTDQRKSRNSFFFKHHELCVEIVIDKTDPVGAADPLGIMDVRLESALTTIIDLEDSVAAVDAEDKVLGYANWLGLMRGDLSVKMEKGGATHVRELEPDKRWITTSGDTVSHPGRAVMFVRNVGHLMTNPAVLLPDGSEAPEGILDALFTSLCALHDLKGLGTHRNSRSGSIYIVKPKQHGPEECLFTNDLFNAVEDILGLPRHTMKVGVMDEERRTSANLAACIHAVRERIVFINTGFLDRTGDEIHTSMQAGAMLPKAAIKACDWIAAYEARNVQIGLACGLSGKAQIGKGMWAAPDMMGDMMVQKIGHPRSGANTAWVPSPTAATLHAIHYHQVDVFARQKELASQPTPGLAPLLTIPLAAPGTNWSEEEVAAELENNAQGILGYVVRWIDQGIGCSKVPDINDVGLMEDRATLRISSQHIANWVLHGVCSEAQVDAALTKMAAKVDAQNAGDALYEKLTPEGIAYRAARALIFEGVVQPSGYTEPLLHRFRQVKKADG
jgi:malate synthase